MRAPVERATDAGLVGIHPRPPDIFRGQPSAFELRSLRELRAAASHVAHESVGPGRLQSALSHWERWRAEAPSRVAFVPLHWEGSPGPAEAERYNAETFELFAASCLRGGSLRQGHIATSANRSRRIRSRGHGLLYPQNLSVLPPETRLHTL